MLRWKHMQVSKSWRKQAAIEKTLRRRFGAPHNEPHGERQNTSSLRYYPGVHQ